MMSRLSISLASMGLALGFLGIVLAVYYGWRSISEGTKATKIGMAAAGELKELPKLSDAVEKSIEAIELGSTKAASFFEKTLELIRVDGKETRQATADLIRLDGKETRQAIVDVHKSIKEEMGKVS